jgi:hypothetical protein
MKAANNIHVFPHFGRWVIFLVTLLLGTASCSNKIEDLPDTDDTALDKERAYNVTFYVSQFGNTKAKLFSNIFERYQNKSINYIDFLDSVYVEFYNENLEIDNVLTSERARYYPESGDIVVRNNVRVITKDNDTLYTDIHQQSCTNSKWSTSNYRRLLRSNERL